ncbi:MAG TPA: RND transporter [Ectothiorhodospiraceae bacterium]|nr:RND transporter [Ectothiorhodospiraceae bacterium]
MKWIDSIPMRHLVLASLMLGLAPFVPEPHLVEKLGMLFDGSLSKPIDIFDLFLHGTPSVILLLKIFRESNKRAEIKK